MSVAMLTGYYPSREANISDDLGMQWTEMSDNSLAGKEVSTTIYVDFPITLYSLTSTEMTALYSFIQTNKAEDITWTLDSINYIGKIRNLSRTMVGNTFTVKFNYYCTEV